MPTTIDVARDNGIVIPVFAWEAAQGARIPFWAACAFLMQESAGGHNVFGHDGGWYSGAGDVTEPKYLTYKAGRAAHNAQGVGPMQLTWPPYQDRADAAGGCWRPYINMLIGFQILAEYVAGGATWHQAAARYNGSETYADQMDTRFTQWQQLLKDATPPGGHMYTGLYAPWNYRAEKYSDGTPKLITLRMRQAMHRLEEACGFPVDSLDLPQGCYHDGSLSAGTHTGADVVDLSDYAYEKKAEEGAKIGLIVFHRPYNWDGQGGGAHCHCILKGSRHLSPQAAAQVTDWDNHLDGLASHRYYTGPWFPVKNFTWQKQQVEQDPPVKWPGVQRLAEHLWQVRQEALELPLDWSTVKQIRADLIEAWAIAHRLNYPPQ